MTNAVSDSGLEHGRLERLERFDVEARHGTTVDFLREKLEDKDREIADLKFEIGDRVRVIRNMRDDKKRKDRAVVWLFLLGSVIFAAASWAA